MKKTKFIYLIGLLLIGLSSCKKPNLNSFNSPPTKKTVVVANPMWTFSRINSNVPVSVNAYILVTGVNGAMDSQTYSSKTQIFNPSNGSMPAFLRITDVDLPTQGPYLVQVFLESIQCTVFPIVPIGCSNAVGARAKYAVSRNQNFQTPTPAGDYVMNNPANLPGICCN